MRPLFYKENGACPHKGQHAVFAYIFVRGRHEGSRARQKIMDVPCGHVHTVLQCRSPRGAARFGLAFGEYAAAVILSIHAVFCAQRCGTAEAVRLFEIGGQPLHAIHMKAVLPAPPRGAAAAHSRRSTVRRLRGYAPAPSLRHKRPAAHRGPPAPACLRQRARPQ